ncbi:MAG: methyltransferase domain-containing protein [Trueperaceae bacterium]
MLQKRATDLPEQMDDPNCDPLWLRNTYAQFALINRMVSGWERVFRRYLAPGLEPGCTILDVGCGGGDLSRNLARWAIAARQPVRVTGIDPDPRALEFARSRRQVEGVEYLQATAEELLSRGRHFDYVVSNHLLHHLPEECLSGFLDTTALLSRRIAVHNDLRRHPAAWLAFGLTRPLFRNSFIVEDGLRSIRRSFTSAELRAVAPAGWRVERLSPFRNLALFEA